MKLGIIGLPLSGKTTLFEALTRTPPDPAKKAENRIATVEVPDERIDVLSRMYNPRKTIHARVEYFLPGTSGGKESRSGGESPWNAVRACDALIHGVRNFSLPGAAYPDPGRDFRKLDEELTFSDLVVVEKRLERLEAERKRGRDTDREEHDLLDRCKTLLESDTPLRRDGELAAAPKLRGYTFLSAKPVLVLVNNEDDDENPPEPGSIPEGKTCVAIRGRIEHEISRMSPEDAVDFLKEYHIAEPATFRVLRESFRVMGLISFFTVGEDEVRAWPIPAGTAAVDAADVIHSDIRKGFIRAEVVSYADLMEAGSHAEARKKGTVRLEGKTYPVKDGDIINFRFNV
ncbi:MAG TPA: redox-regulated ATPase YchF [bacterium]|nr:redox-regulated ATPase YchF [bacterium]